MESQWLKRLRWSMLFLKQDVDIKWVEYQNMVMYLSQWIKHNVTVMADRNFPSNPVELKVRESLTMLPCFKQYKTDYDYVLI